MLKKKENNRFEELVHYVISLDVKNTLGSTKLNKVLFFIDFQHYIETGKSVSGETSYTKRQYGMVPNNMMKTYSQLQDKHLIKITESSSKFIPTTYEALQKNEGIIFSDDEKKLIKEVIAVSQNLSAADMSEITHDNIWSMAADGEKVPLCAYFALETLIRKDCKKWAQDAFAENREYIDGINQKEH